MNISHTSKWIAPMARIGLVAKGIVYLLLGTLAFMAAFEIGGQTSDQADKEGVFEAVRDNGGNILLFVLIIGLLCYSAWRIIQPFSGRLKSDNDKKGLAKKARYISSGITYFSVALLAGKILLNKHKHGSSNSMLPTLLSSSWGQVVVAIFALVLAATGVYQLYYGLTEKYKKHVTGLNLATSASRLLLRAGKVGYVARGIVWLLISLLMMKAMMHANSNEAGNSGKAFSFLESASYGSYLLGILGLGLICYGLFNFIRSRYDNV